MVDRQSGEMPSSATPGHRPRPGVARLPLAVLALTLLGVVGPTVPHGQADGSDPTLAEAPDGIRGGHYMSSVADLDAAGYVEREVFLSGTATRHPGLTAASIFPGPPQSASPTAPFATRLVVRHPADPDEFNGVVLVEWFNVTSQLEIDLDWGVGFRHLIDQGYGYVGVSAQETGVRQLKAWDPVRYASLQHPGDDFSYDIFEQAIAALRAGDVLDEPLPAPDTVLASGHSQSGGFLHRFVEQVQTPDHHVADGFLIRGDDDRTFDFPDGRTDPSVPVLHYWSETEAVGLAHSMSRGMAATSKDPFKADSGTYRLWHIAGAAHNDNWSNMIWLQGQVARDWSGLPVPWDADTYGQYGAEPGYGLCDETGARLNEFPQRYSLDAAIEHLTRWARDSEDAPASQQRFEWNADNTLKRDVHGNVLGGIRYPVVDVPVATYRGDRGCPLSGQTTPLSDATLQALYPTNAAYVAAMQTAADAMRASGMLLDIDHADLLARAERAPVPRG